MRNIKAGLVAGFSATVVLSAMMVGKTMMGVPPVFSWLAHFMIGTIAWGAGFAILCSAVPGSGAVQKSILFGIPAWAGMMIVVMQMTGVGLFGMAFGIMAPMMSLVLYVVFGGVQGAVYQAQFRPALA